MSGKNIRAIIVNTIPPVLVLAFLAAFFIMSSGRFRQGFPEIWPEEGYVDLREYDFNDEIYQLAYTWNYYPGALYSPEDFADEKKATHPDNDAKDVRLGTYRLRMLAKPNQWLSLCSFSIDYGTRVFLNGQEVRNIGFVSDDPNRAIPKVRHMTIPMFSGETGEIELIYQYSNHVHEDGGFIQSTYISTPENIDEYERGAAYWSLLIGSGLLFLMFWFLLSASIQKNREFAALAICCLLIALRNQFFFGEYMLDPGYDFFWEYRIVVLDVSLIPASSLYLLYAFFPKIIKRWTAYALVGLFAVLTALHWIVDTEELVNLCHICYYVCVPFLLWSIFALCRFCIRVRRPNLMEWFTLGAVGFLMFMIIREGMSTGTSQSVNHFGITPLVIVISVMMLAVVINTRIQRRMIEAERVQQENRLLEQINDMNRDFLRMVAHELNTPLTVISGYAQLIERKMERKPSEVATAASLTADSPDKSSADNEKVRERLHTIHREADRLGTIVTRLMDYSHNREHIVEMSDVNVQELLNSVAAVMTPVCAKRENTMTVRNDYDGTLHGNRELLLQILINLISNASRHTERGTITVETRAEEKSVTFLVSDTGIGISPEVAPHIFEKGYTTGGGNGLGLAICMESVQLHGGEMALESTGPEGTTFRFTIPR